MKKTAEVTFNVTWNKGKENELTREITRTFDASAISEDDVFEYALRSWVINEQAKCRAKESREIPENAVIKLSAPNTRVVSAEKFEIITYLVECGLTSEVAGNMAKLRNKDEKLVPFIKRLQGMLSMLGMTIDLTVNLPETTEE